MNNEYHEGEHVVYGNTGVCLVDGISSMAFSQDQAQLYYVLLPLDSNSSVIYVPCGNENLVSKIRYTLTKEDIGELLERIKDQQLDWIEDRKERSEYFHTVTFGEDPQQLLLAISCLYLKKCELAASGKKLSASDEGALEFAEKRIVEEFSFSLNISKEAVGEYIRDKLSIAQEC